MNADGGISEKRIFIVTLHCVLYCLSKTTQYKIQLHPLGVHAQDILRKCLQATGACTLYNERIQKKYSISYQIIAKIHITASMKYFLHCLPVLLFPKRSMECKSDRECCVMHYCGCLQDEVKISTSTKTGKPDPFT